MIAAYRPRFLLGMQKCDLLHALMFLSPLPSLTNPSLLTGDLTASLGLTPNPFSLALPGSGYLLPQQQLQQMQQLQAMSQKLLLEQRVCADGFALCPLCVYHM